MNILYPQLYFLLPDPLDKIMAYPDPDGLPLGYSYISTYVTAGPTEKYEQFTQVKPYISIHQREETICQQNSNLQQFFSK